MRFARCPCDAPAGTIARPTAPPASVTSASTVGRPRLSQTRRARDAADAAVGVGSSARAAVAPGAPATVVLMASVRSAGVGRQASDRPRSTRRDARRARASVVVDVLDRRLAVDAREQQARQQRRGAALDRRARLPVDARRDTPSPSASKRARKAAVAAGVHRHLSSRWLRQNARSNAGSPHHAHSASSSTGPSAPIRMFFGLTSPWTSATLASLRRRAPAARAPARGPDGGARSRAGKARGGCRRRSRRSSNSRGERGPRGRIRVDARQRRADRARGRRVGVGRRAAAASTARWLAGGEVAHDEDAEARMLAEHARRAAGHAPRWRPASSAPRSGCARSARASRRRRAASPARAWRRPGRARCRCARCPTRRRRSSGAPTSALGAGQAELAQRLARTRRHGDRRRRASRRRRPSAARPRCASTSLTSACSAWLAGVGDAELAAAARDEAVEVVDLARLAARHVLRGRRELGRHRGGDALHRLERRARAAGRRLRPRRARRPRATTACCSSRTAGSAASSPYGACASPEIAL